MHSFVRPAANLVILPLHCALSPLLGSDAPRPSEQQGFEWKQCAEMPPKSLPCLVFHFQSPEENAPLYVLYASGGREKVSDELMVMREGEPLVLAEVKSPSAAAPFMPSQDPQEAWSLVKRALQESWPPAKPGWLEKTPLGFERATAVVAELFPNGDPYSPGKYFPGGGYTSLHVLCDSAGVELLRVPSRMLLVD